MVGVYKIKCLENSFVYIGSSEYIEKRIKKHKYDLRNGIHNNELLQENWNLYGEDKFEFLVLSECKRDVLTYLEQSYTILYDSCLRGYNIILANKNRYKTINDIVNRTMLRLYNDETISEVFKYTFGGLIYSNIGMYSEQCLGIVLIIFILFNQISKDFLEKFKISLYPNGLLRDYRIINYDLDNFTYIAYNEYGEIIEKGLVIDKIINNEKEILLWDMQM